MWPDAWGAWNWWGTAAALTAVMAVVCLISYGWLAPRLDLTRRLMLGLVKWLAISLLALCLLEPQISRHRAVPQANLIAVLADNSRSLQLLDAGSSSSRAQQLKQQLTEQTAWLQSLEQEFEVRRYLVDRQVQAVTDFQAHEAQTIGSHLSQSLQQMAQRFQDRPIAGIILLSDGNSTDIEAFADTNFNTADLPPVYPVVVGRDVPQRDLQIVQITSSQTNFESAPITISAQLKATGMRSDTVAVVLQDVAGKELQRQLISNPQDNQAFAVRFQTNEFQRGASFYRISAFARGDESAFEKQTEGIEASWWNNQKWTVVDRGRGPFQILYLAGKPNWDFKFLNRALLDDPELQLSGLLRVAEKEAKFTFRGYLEQQSNQLFRGFKNHDEDAAESRGESVVLRVGFDSAEQLKQGFPQTTEELFAYDAVILDDVEASFFSEAQKSAIQQFVSRRGGALLMLGGANSFAAGRYDKTPIGEMLPIYLDRNVAAQTNQFQLELTRDGWLQPWLRLESTENEELRRMTEMPAFRTLNLATAIKPGATVLSQLRDQQGQSWPGLITHSFGKGKTAAMLIGDLWRWQMQGDATDSQKSDLAKSWRQTVRWLVADVPRFVEVQVVPHEQDPDRYYLSVLMRDPNFKPMDNASVKINVQGPNQKSFELTAEPNPEIVGRYDVEVYSREPGPWRASAVVTDTSGETLPPREIGWTVEPGGREFDFLKPNREWLDSIARETGGKVYDLSELDKLAAELPWQQVPVSETYIEPWWHRWPFLLIALALLVFEWGLRRRLGMP